ncbi:DNA-binding Xre family transcriptional regulator [Chryseobacterium sp. 7]|uniref:helix-turn-helix domain-containing protein n=1 Tax=Chryseobacterium sp. 7 TaxID=2035214 RepID=UPI000EAC8DC7|nr:helix-turn-helix transcriptional regulator [Chryseobacterium sp. 7]RLJ33872.1 DNA-binding Xre family transcriptional regulator [Chryseobacterium sp. 7]
MEILRIKEVAKLKGYSLEDISSKLGISYVALYKKLKTAKLDTLKEIAEILQCDIHELLEPGSQYAHFYDPKTEEWLGIRKR